MSSVELTVTVQDEEKVLARGQDDAEETGKVELDPLRRATIEIFEDWLKRSMISKRRELEVLGTHLYRVLFNGKVGDFFERTQDNLPQGQRLRVQLNFQEAASRLASLPWEYLYRPDTETSPGFFLSTHVELVLSRYMLLKKSLQPLTPAESPLRILVVVSQPEDLGPVAAGEVIKAVEEVADIEVKRLDEPTPGNFVDKLKKTQPHVLHFIGHGRFKKVDKKCEIALLMADGKSVRWVADKEFREYFEQTPEKPQLVFLHLCEGAMVDFEPNFVGLTENLRASQANARSMVDFEANFARLAPELIRTGIPAVLAMQYPITNRAAIAFSRAFYRELANGEPIDHAVQVARRQITVEVEEAYNTRVFGTPVLYMRSRGGIIKQVAKGEPDAGAEGRQLESAITVHRGPKPQELNAGAEGRPLESVGSTSSAESIILKGGELKAEKKSARQLINDLLYEGETMLDQAALSNAPIDAAEEKPSSIRNEQSLLNILQILLDKRQQ